MQVELGAKGITVAKLGEAEVMSEAGLDDLLDGSSRMEFLLRFTLSQADVHTTIVGTASPEHLAANLAAAKAGPLSDDVTAETRRRLEAATAS